MPPKRIEEQPVIDRATSDIPMEEGTSDASTQRQHRDTRAAHGDKLRRYIEEMGRIPVTFRKSDGRLTGQHASFFMTKLDVAVKKFAPLQVADCRHIIEEQKRPIFDWLSAMFTVDFGTGPESVKKETDKLMSTRYRDNRQKMHRHYKSLTTLSWEERLQHMPHDFYETEADWEYMCTLFELDEFKKRSATNSANRVKLPYNDRRGSKSFLQYSYDGTDGTSRKDRITIFNETHYNTTKGWVGDRAQSAYDEMVRLREEHR